MTSSSHKLDILSYVCYDFAVTFKLSINFTNHPIWPPNVIIINGAYRSLFNTHSVKIYHQHYPLLGQIDATLTHWHVGNFDQLAFMTFAWFAPGTCNNNLGNLSRLQEGFDAALLLMSPWVTSKLTWAIGHWLKTGVRFTDIFCKEI